MTPVWRALSTVVALVVGFALPLFAVSVFLGVKHHGAMAIVGLVAFLTVLTLLILVARGRLHF